MKRDFLTLEKLEQYLNLLKEAEKIGDVVALKEILRDVVSGFTPEKDIVDVVYNQKQQ